MIFFVRSIVAKILVGLLAFILTTFIASVSAGEAEAPSAKIQEKAAEGKVPNPKGVDAKSVESDRVAQAPASSCLASELVLEDLKKTRETNDAKAKELAEKEIDLKAREQILNDELKKIEQVRDSIALTKENKKKDEDVKIAKLVETFLTMNPKSASKLLSTLDDDLAVSVVARMDTPKLAKILNLMDPVRSSKLSELLAGVVHSKNERKNE